MQRHWEGLTRFLHVPGAPLENNTIERELRTAVRHRKNSLFYKNQTGACVGDVLMSAIRTSFQSSSVLFSTTAQP